MTDFYKNNINDAISTLSWYVEAGVDELVVDKANDYIALSKEANPFVSATAFLAEEKKVATTNSHNHNSAKASSSSLDSNPQKSNLQVHLQETISQDKKLKDIASLAELKAFMLSFTSCSLQSTAMNLVFASGNPMAKIMVIGEAPGAEEDRKGQAFVGRSGMLLDKMLASIGLFRDTNVYISNIVPWRPPGNRTPSSAEVAICLPFIKKHIQLVNPDILLLLGKSAASGLLGTVEPITRIRGKWQDYPVYQDKVIPCMTTFHPSFLLREPLQKRLAWQDMLLLRHLAVDKGII